MRKIIKINAIVLSFVFLTGFLPLTTLVGPASTIISTGNVYKAGFQFMIDKGIQEKTGKNSFTIVKEEIEKKNNSIEFNKKFRKLVEERIKIAREKIELQNINQ